MADPAFVTPRIDGARHRWELGEVSFEVDAARGARVVAFAIGAENILSGPEVNALNFGSTFWTSPQAQWGWPPEEEIDSEPYDVHGAGADVVFAGRPGRRLGLAVSKRFVVSAAAETVTAHYTIDNRSGQERTVAPWEISRVPTGGLTFFPAGEGIYPPTNLAVRQAEGLVWFDYDAAAITDHQKLFADGSEGWIAHLDIARRMLLVKTFPEVPRPRHAPGEAEIEVYADPQHTYVEVEQQGAYAPLPPGERVTWSVTWRLRRLPPGIEAAPGSRDLAALVRGMIAAR